MEFGINYFHVFHYLIGCAFERPLGAFFANEKKLAYIFSRRFVKIYVGSHLRQIQPTG